MINWPFSIAASLVIHAVGLALLFSIAEPSNPMEDASAGEEALRSDASPPGSAPSADVAPSAHPLSGDRRQASVPSPAVPAWSGAAPAAHSAPIPAPAQQASNTIVYVVVKGDSLTKIAAANCCTVTELAKLNKIKPSSGLRIGQKLRIPAPAEATR